MNDLKSHSCILLMLCNCMMMNAIVRCSSWPDRYKPWFKPTNKVIICQSLPSSITCQSHYHCKFAIVPAGDQVCTKIKDSHAIEHEYNYPLSDHDTSSFPVYMRKNYQVIGWERSRLVVISWWSWMWSSFWWVWQVNSVFLVVWVENPVLERGCCSVQQPHS